MQKLIVYNTFIQLFLLQFKIFGGVEQYKYGNNKNIFIITQLIFAMMFRVLYLLRKINMYVVRLCRKHAFDATYYFFDCIKYSWNYNDKGPWVGDG